MCVSPRVSMLTGVNSFHVLGVRALVCSLILATPAAGGDRAAALTQPAGEIGRVPGTAGPVTGPAGARGTAGMRRPGEVPVSSPLWGWPLAGRPRVLRGFAPPARPWLAGHRGVDLAALPGTEVRAAGAGTVGYAGPLADRGVVTVLHPGGLRTSYLPVQPLVRRGRTVAIGEVIGVLQDVSGHCPTSCLHWGLLRDRAYLDPLLLLGHGQVRLLPRWTDQAPSLRLPR